MRHETTLRVEGMPDLIAALRRELADVLRRQADSQAHPVARDEMRRVAAAFEAGVSDA